MSGERPPFAFHTPTSGPSRGERFPAQLWRQWRAAPRCACARDSTPFLLPLRQGFEAGLRGCGYGSR